MNFTFKLSIAAIILIFSLTSCEDFFETTLELDPPPFEKTLVVDCVSNNMLDTIQMRISQNQGILEDKPNYALDISDADVYLNVNGMELKAATISSLDRNDNRNNYRVVLPSKLKSGDNVQIKVTHKDFNEAGAAMEILPTSDILSAVFSENGGLDRDGNKKSKVSVTFNDPKGKNFYAIKISVPNYDDISDYTYITSVDPSAYESYDYETLLLSDEGFDGEKKVIDFLIDPLYYDNDKGKIKLNWYHISEDYFKFSRSLRAYKNTEDNPFGSPVPVISNINGGVGIFAIHNLQIVDVE